MKHSNLLLCTLLVSAVVGSGCQKVPDKVRPAKDAVTGACDAKLVDNLKTIQQNIITQKDNKDEKAVASAKSAQASLCEDTLKTIAKASEASCEVAVAGQKATNVKVAEVCKDQIAAKTTNDKVERNKLIKMTNDICGSEVTILSKKFHGQRTEFKNTEGKSSESEISKNLKNLLDTLNQLLPKLGKVDCKMKVDSGFALIKKSELKDICERTSEQYKKLTKEEIKCDIGTDATVEATTKEEKLAAKSHADCKAGQTFNAEKSECVGAIVAAVEGKVTDQKVPEDRKERAANSAADCEENESFDKDLAACVTNTEKKEAPKADAAPAAGASAKPAVEPAAPAADAGNGGEPTPEQKKQAGLDELAKNVADADKAKAEKVKAALTKLTAFAEKFKNTIVNAKIINVENFKRIATDVDDKVEPADRLGLHKGKVAKLADVKADLNKSAFCVINRKDIKFNNDNSSLINVEGKLNKAGYQILTLTFSQGSELLVMNCLKGMSSPMVHDDIALGLFMTVDFVVKK